MSEFDVMHNADLYDADAAQSARDTAEVESWESMPAISREEANEEVAAMVADRDRRQREEDGEPHSVTVIELASHRLGRKAIHGGDFEEAGLPMMGGCEICGASIAAYNACPSKSGFLRCADNCIADQGWPTVEEANRDIFEAPIEAYEDDDDGR